MKRRTDEVNKIQELKRSIDKKCASKKFKQVNKCINEIISDKPKAASIEEIKALICHLEGNSNQANAYTVMGICYSFAIGSISTYCTYNIVSSNEGAFLSSVLLPVAALLALIAIIIKRKDYKKAFILKVLNYKLEELNNMNPNEISDEGKNVTNILLKSVKSDLTETPELELTKNAKHEREEKV